MRISAFGQLAMLLPMFGIVRLVTGPLGTGKSYYGVRMATDALMQGALVATNFDMSPDWVDRVVRHGHIRKHTKKLDRRVEEFEKRYIRIHTMEDLRKLRVRPVEPWATELEPGKWQVKEGSMVVVLDESHRWMNARSWSKEGREHLLEYFALARKRGMVIYLIAQRAENLDVQVRELFEDHIHLKNLRRSMRVLGIAVCPWNIFIAGWTNHAYPDEVVRCDRYRLDWRRSLYDTMDTISFKEGRETGDLTYLPLLQEGDLDGEQSAPPAPASVAAGVGAVAAGEAQLEGGDVLAPPAPVPSLEGDPTAPVEFVDPSGRS